MDEDRLEVRRKNAIALNDEQIRQRLELTGAIARITQLESEIVLLRQEMASVKGLALLNIGTGATAG